MAASDLSFQRACHVKGDSQRLASLSEGLGVAGDRLKIGGLGVDQTTFGNFRSNRSIRKATQRNRAKGQARIEFWPAGTTTQIKDGTKSSVTKTKLIEGYYYSRELAPPTSDRDLFSSRSCRSPQSRNQLSCCTDRSLDRASFEAKAKKKRAHHG